MTQLLDVVPRTEDGKKEAFRNESGCLGIVNLFDGDDILKVKIDIKPGVWVPFVLMNDDDSTLQAIYIENTEITNRPELRQIWRWETLPDQVCFGEKSHVCLLDMGKYDEYINAWKQNNQQSMANDYWSTMAASAYGVISPLTFHTAAIMVHKDKVFDEITGVVVLFADHVVPEGMKI
jgi:hypothetical protein